MSVDWGDAPAWVTVSLTLIGLSLASVKLGRTVLDNRKLAAPPVWVLCERYTYGDGEGAPSDCEATVSNRSGEPVFECRVHLLNWEWQANRRVLCGRIFPVIRPHSESECVPLGPLEPPPAKVDRDRLPPLEIEFTDGRGGRWRRAPNAELEKM